MTREVRFCVTCADTRVGQHIRIVGSSSALGKWNPPNSPQLATSATDFPLWRSTALVVVDEEAPLEYKYVICNNDGGAMRWEERPNRSLHLKPLTASNIVGKSGSVNVMEQFNGMVNPEDPSRFSGVERGNSRQILSIRKGSHNYPEREHPPAGERVDGADMFEPTMRERNPSFLMLAQMNRNSSSATSHSHFGGLGLADGDSSAPEVTNEDEEAPAAEESAGLSGLGGSCGTSLHTFGEGLVREESCSNLFLNEFDDEQVEQVENEFERKYTLVGQGPLGEGTFGLVWRCTPQNMKEGVEKPERAAKIVRKKRLEPRDMKYLLGDDGEIATHLTMKHPNIVELFEYFDESLNVTLVLEFCSGGDLFDAIIDASKSSGRGLAENAAAVATTHLLRALAYIHGQSVVHRDVKCENVLLNCQGTPAEQNVYKLCDFGFAAHDRGEGFNDRLGSPDTVAPEVVAGTRYSFPADLWSCGTVVYMMLSATPPFYAPTDQDVLRKVRAGNYSLSGQLWDSISAPPKHIITSLMTVDAKLRPTASEALTKAWLKDVPETPGPRQASASAA